MTLNDVIYIFRFIFTEYFPVWTRKYMSEKISSNFAKINFWEAKYGSQNGGNIMERLLNKTIVKWKLIIFMETT